MSPAARQSFVVAPTDWWTRIQQAVGTVAALGTLVVIVFSWQSIKQVEDEHALTRKGQVTDRYNTAVGDIGEDSLEIRLSGIYALQRIMEESPHDQPSIINILSAYIRNHAKEPKPEPIIPEGPTSDIQAALTALGNRDPSYDSTARIDLHGAYLARANLEGAYLGGAHMDDVNLSVAMLDRVNLSGASLDRVNLSGARLERANLSGASLYFADLRGAYLSRANLKNMWLLGAKLDHANLQGADLTDTDLNLAKLGDAKLDGRKR
ncbi:pentapeptide repeat-containing protein [Streptomyces sp. NPDC060366]|uniref:pentapeptide repeat-containing protein n=1 Tax=Streptomyces sp. NPDC060366 TaxID=3347105 RepID=UPI0036487E7D